MTKRITPYQRLLNAARQYADDVDFPVVRPMWSYPKNRLREFWPLDAVAERAAAAEQLGFEVVLSVVEGNLVMKYRSSRPARPLELR